MWTYRQSTGELLQDGQRVAAGYAGNGAGKNNPAMQDQHNVGPLPRGRYTLCEPVDTQEHGPFVLRLIPAPGNVMHGRAGFLVHGDSIKAPGTASQGCMIFPRAIRAAMWASGDRALEVVE